MNQDLIDLATAYKRGEECGFALHDALCEAGFPKLAEAHFPACKEITHCWAEYCSVIDSILNLGRYNRTLEDQENSIEKELLPKTRN